LVIDKQTERQNHDTISAAEENTEVRKCDSSVSMQIEKKRQKEWTLHCDEDVDQTGYLSSFSNKNICLFKVGWHLYIRQGRGKEKKVGGCKRTFFKN